MYRMNCRVVFCEMIFNKSRFTFYLAGRVFVLLMLVSICPIYANENSTPDDFIVGRWEQVASKSDAEGASYSYYPENTRFFKTYVDGHFHMVYRYDGGKAYVVYGGRYQVVAPGRVEEVIEYYFPRSQRYYGLGSKGQGILYSSKSMTGAQILLEFEIDEDLMIQKGVLIQNHENLSDPDNFGDKAIDYIYERASSLEIKSGERQ